MAKRISGDNHTVSTVSSIKTKILLLVMGVIFITAIINLLISVPLIKTEISTLIKNYMNGLAASAGENLAREVELLGTEEVLKPEKLSGLVGSIKVKDMDSSYCYVVSADSMMLYHPTAEKINQPVENDAVKHLLGEMAKGSRPETDVITYVFNGVNKYASYYISENMDYILILTADEDEALKPVNTVILKSVIGLICILVVCGFVSIIISGRLSKPIIGITKDIKKLSDLDLTNHDTLSKYAERKDETGAIAKTAIVLREKLTGSMTHIKAQSHELYGASDAMHTAAEEVGRSISQVSRAVGEIANGAASQAQETQTATENIIVMGNMITDTNNKIEELMTNAGEMHAAGDKALEILNRLSSVNQKVREVIQVIYTQTTHTSNSVVEIKKATDIITNIAEETNMLSLNASIEAARAGEAGRGFAVVASQIQQLAEQSNTSANQINNTINSLIAEFEETMKTMESVKGIITKQNEDVMQTEQAFSNVKAGIAKSIESIRSIAAKTEKLDEARINVVDVVQGLTSIAEENAAGTEETEATMSEVNSIMVTMSDTVKQLNQIANELEESIDMFQL